MRRINSKYGSFNLHYDPLRSKAAEQVVVTHTGPLCLEVTDERIIAHVLRLALYDIYNECEHCALSDGTLPF